jgi:predicted HicB family RNase H-like nuclease
LEITVTTLEYKGYQGSAEFDLKTGVLFGKILFVTDLVTYEAESVPALQNEFQLAVDDYLDTCQKLGRNPQQPCSGVFNVRVGPDLHRAAVMRAQKDGVKLNAVMVSALEQYLSDATIKHAHQHDHTLTVKVVSLSDVKKPETRMYSADQSQQFEMHTNVTH